ncbi:peptidyl-prolyl cis-trans isomerase CYP21-3, mitochondrial-like [Olea europaea var. sylvestris]|uniref:Peptidyl-prolyl cis-trans isomerase n=1 Tax=Olea europaea subsp. europaea TaxID=158383 RepID=A0A8S0QRF3_OLEEU|nr:peptidyl-prolyl cis-trans isomerase CYP21-3, mitochondrial-like [Olea europaea var. sylvestris]XP_022847239.1 peptidyl-prolyl cis-trans isomerase CYP21-3, mitochondrial-like [Olea europaea var. sylvestris]XP_022847240.1 peptidyl-prolyl cis-trans isomerase CYP21-3, mitochondrial-like [Olea europaea var. sylvestris]XP_022847241.1 peptidyl-prolyl cis-trans isomerase CYP21-3, mitochondrial-like [Olea europaea var. sylvestris]CAA2967011.1 peptidyl-prolyl cis-trans isomerase CYP21-4 [Olea europaea
MARIKPQALLQQSKKKKRPSGISVTSILIYALIVVVMVFFLYSSYRHWSRRSQFHMENASLGVEHDNMFGDIEKAVVIPKYAVISTSKGSITVELYDEGSPHVVAEFIDSSKKGRFKGRLFNHVIKNFVIQAGDVDRPGTVEDWTSRGKHYNQLDTSLKHEAFMLGTSKAKQDGSGFHLFITTAPIADLNEKISVFGRVVKGEEVVQEIEEVDSDEHYQPKTPIEIIDVNLKQKI